MKTLNQSTSMKHLFLMLVIACLFLPLPVLAIQTQSGDLLIELDNIDYGDKDENSWQQPTLSTQDTFGQVIDRFLAEDFSAADALASAIGYEVVEFSDTSTKPVQTHYILREKNPLPSTQFIGGGTYVIYPRGENVAIQAPHPKTDSFTGTQAIETYLASQSRLLFLPGVRRDNSTELSQCTNASYRRSDASHYTEQLFYIAHQRASDTDPNLVFIQLHGFGAASLANLQNQCGTNNDNLINLSEGVNYYSAPSANTFMQILKQKINDQGVIKACVFGNETSSLGATWTTTGRYSNNSPDSCLTNASISSERFIHVEQSYRVRSNHRTAVADHIASTITDYFKQSGAATKTKGGKK